MTMTNLSCLVITDLVDPVLSSKLAGMRNQQDHIIALHSARRQEWHYIQKKTDRETNNIHSLSLAIKTINKKERTFITLCGIIKNARLPPGDQTAQYLNPENRLFYPFLIKGASFQCCVSSWRAEEKKKNNNNNNTKKEGKFKIPYSSSARPVPQQQNQQPYHPATGSADEPKHHWSWWCLAGCGWHYWRCCCCRYSRLNATDDCLSTRHDQCWWQGRPCQRKSTCDAGCSHAWRGCSLPPTSVGREVVAAGERCGFGWLIQRPCLGPPTGWVHWYGDLR